ncbi:MAG: hypothetical protein ACOZIN_17220, partial [Myxococcota bacterium]
PQGTLVAFRNVSNENTKGGGKKPSAFKPPAPAPRPRAQVAYEGDDAFSLMSTDESVRAQKKKVELKPGDPGYRPPAPVPSDQQPKGNSAWQFFRKIFGD